MPSGAISRSMRCRPPATALCMIMSTALPMWKRGMSASIGNAATRIEEDYLRILRFFRFHAAYGEGAPDKAALEGLHCRAGRT